MARINRKTQKVFAENATNNGQFGSAQIGTKVTSQDLDTLQALSAFGVGWADAVISGERLPTLEEMQTLHYITTRQIAYIMQEGIPEYDSGTTYYENSIVRKSGTCELYKSLTDDNIGNALTDETNWLLLIDLENFSTNFTDLTDTPANYTDKAGYKLKVNAGADAVEFVDDTFLSLSDTPEAYTASKFLAVNGAGDAIELVDTPSSVTLYTKTLTTAMSLSVTANTFYDIGLSIASVVVPTGAKVKISGFVSVASNGGVGTVASVRLKRGSTVIGVGTSVGSRTAVTSSAHMYYTGDRPWAIPFEFVESPTAGTYKYSAEASTLMTTLWINRSDYDSDSSQYYRSISQLTVEVIK